MKTYLLVILTSCLLFGNATAQKTLKEAVKVEEKAIGDATSNRIDKLMTSKEFEFVANTAIPMRMASKSVVGSNYNVRFSPSKIVSVLPYFGSVRGGIAIGKDDGLRFEGTPKEYTVKQSEKAYFVTATVETKKDRFELEMVVGDSGYATLTIKSRNRDSITYQGEVK